MRVLTAALLAIPVLAHAVEPDIEGPYPTTVEAAETGSGRPQRNDSVFDNLRREPGTFTLVSEKRRLSFHKPMYAMPLTWSPDYSSEASEVVFQISLKQRLFNRNFFFGYTQRSFWQLYNATDSRPFRETNYNPELFYRWKPQWERVPGLGFDIGIDHESNGKSLPDSRSWNRIIGAAYYETARQLLHLRLWYRLPEDDDRAEDDPKRDDNPDIYKYYGYGELRLQRQLFGEPAHQLSLMLRGNSATGKGAMQLVYSAPFSDWAFWNVYVWNGYGESLIEYDRSVTRVGIGLMLAR
jgi:phospholipase A1/A2